MGTLPLPPEPSFFKKLEPANTVYGTSIHIQNINTGVKIDCRHSVAALFWKYVSFFDA